MEELLRIGLYCCIGLLVLAVGIRIAIRVYFNEKFRHFLRLAAKARPGRQD